MAAIYHHARRLWIGTAAEMAAAAATLDVDGVGTRYWDTTYARLYIWNGVSWVVGEIPLVFLGNYTQGYMIRGGAMDWEAFGAGGVGYAIVSTGIAPAFDQTPTWTGQHTFAAGLAVAIDQAIAMGAGATIDGLDLSELGTMLFTKADGLLLLGPFSEIDRVSWWSHRHQKATLSGSFHREAGRWPDTKGVVVEAATTNLVTNPSFEVNITDGWTLDAGGGSGGLLLTTVSIVGSHCCLLYAGDGADSTMRGPTQVVADGESITIQAWMYRNHTDTISLNIYDSTSGVRRATYDMTLKSQWEYAECTWTNDQGGNRTCCVEIRNEVQDDASYGIFDAVQMEHDQAWATTYCDGTLGTGYAWTGAAHNSTSTRTANSIVMDTLAAVLEGNAAFSVRIMAQAPFDHDAVWPQQYNVFWYAREDGDNRILLYYEANNDRIYMQVEEGGVSKSAYMAATFHAGDWLDIVVNIDFAGNLELFVNGILAMSTDMSALSAITPLSTWSVGSDVTEALQSGLVICEYAVLDRVLTADEIANLHALQRPLVDAVPVDGPHISADTGTFERVSIGAAGIGQGPLHGYGTVGGFMYWDMDNVGAGPYTVLAGGVGDVTKTLWVAWVVAEITGAGVNSNFSTAAPGAGLNIYNDGTDTLVLTVGAGGDVTVARSAGADTFKVALWLMWI